MRGEKSGTTDLYFLIFIFIVYFIFYLYLFLLIDIYFLIWTVIFTTPFPKDQHDASLWAPLKRSSPGCLNYSPAHRQEDRPVGPSGSYHSALSLCNMLSSFQRFFNCFLKLMSYLLRAGSVGRNYWRFQSIAYQPYSRFQAEVESQIPLPFVRGRKEICMFAFVNAKTVSRRLTINSQWLLPWGRGTRVKGGRKIYFTLYISHTFWRVIKLKNNTCNKNWSLETISAGALHQKNNDDDLASWLTYSAWQPKSLLVRRWAPWRQGTL